MLNLLHNHIYLLKQIFLSSLSRNVLNICSSLVLKFVDNPTQNLSIFSSRAHYARALFFLLFAYCSSLYSDPWGKDADLISPPSEIIKKSTISTSLLGSVGESLIKFHQNIISPIDGPRSHFLPSSSQYTLEAMRKYGFFIGYMYGCDRLMRENSDPWIYPKVTDSQGYALKYNPVH